MKIDLPLEVWEESFKKLPREQLAALLPHLGDEQEEESQNRPIADRQFVSFVQYYLHECGDVTLGCFSIKSSSNGPVFVNKAGQELPLAEVPPMPSNIKSFELITINYYDQSVLDFLQEFRRNSLLTDVNLKLINLGDSTALSRLMTQCVLNREPLRDAMSLSKMMTQLLPSITSIESLNLYECYDHSALFQGEHSAMMASVRILNGREFGVGSNSTDCYRHWLHIPRSDGKPRVLVATNVVEFGDGIYPILPFIENIKKDFLDANQAVSFFAFIICKLEAVNVQSISLANDKTQEQLLINANGPHPLVIITRCPMGATEIEGNLDMRNGMIFFPERKIEVDLN